MKKLLISILLGIILFGCFEINEPEYYYSGESAKFTEVVPGGCATGDYSSEKSSSFSPDTVSYNIIDQELNINVGFTRNCCSEYVTFSEIRSDTILINMLDTSTISCNCICYYSYDFRYSDVSRTYNCIITLNNYPFYSGMIEP